MGPPSGIHWSMALGKKVEFVATDEALQEIPWARVTDRETGVQTVYRSDGRSGDDPPPVGTRRTVDCMDCHNRSTHVFRTPSRAVNSALIVEPELRSIPFAKRELVAAIVKPYPSREEGRAGVTSAVRGFYQDDYPEVFEARGGEVDRLIEIAKACYNRSFFPRMNVSWRTYCNNIGHLEFAGCFRCHDGKHVDDEGNPITRECSACHDFLVPASSPDESSLLTVGGFQHPVELEGIHETMRCNDCHTGGIAPSSTCAGCHTTQAQYIAGTLPALASFDIAADSMAEMVDCEECHDLSSPKDIATINEACLDCHDDEEERFADMLPSWKAEVDGLLKKARARTDERSREALEALAGAGPLHNIEASRKILRDIIGEAEGSSP
jgi:hypothetical protein